MTVVLFDGRRRHLAAEGRRLDDGHPGFRDPATGRVTPPIPPQSAWVAACGAAWWPLTTLADDVERHAGDRIARRMYLIWQARPMCPTCATHQEAA